MDNHYCFLSKLAENIAAIFARLRRAITMKEKTRLYDSLQRELTERKDEPVCEPKKDTLANTIPDARTAYQECIPHALQHIGEKIAEARNHGHTSCRISMLSIIPMEAIRTLLDKGYDVSYYIAFNEITEAYVNWNEQASGKVIKQKPYSDHITLSSIEEMYGVV